MGRHEDFIRLFTTQSIIQPINNSLKSRHVYEIIACRYGKHT
jgi:hypothetical protein